MVPVVAGRGFRTCVCVARAANELCQTCGAVVAMLCRQWLAAPVCLLRCGTDPRSAHSTKAHCPLSLLVAVCAVLRMVGCALLRAGLFFLSFFFFSRQPYGLCFLYRGWGRCQLREASSSVPKSQLLSFAACGSNRTALLLPVAWYSVSVGTCGLPATTACVHCKN